MCFLPRSLGQEIYFKRQADKTNVNPSEAKRVPRKRKF